VVTLASAESSDASAALTPCAAYFPIHPFQSERLRQPAIRARQNDFSAFPNFSRGVLIVSDNIAMKIGGYVKADLIQEEGAIGSTDLFNTTLLPTSGPDRKNVRFHARQSRLSFDTRWRTEGEVVRTFIEGDFFGGSSDSPEFRLRHAYGKVGRLTAGQTWTTFTDPSALPQTLDLEGAVSNVNRRQGQIRWDQPLSNDAFSMAVALEDSRVLVEAPSLALGEGRTEHPDLITHVRYERDWAEFQSACVLRTVGFERTGEPVVEENAWGCNLTGSFLVIPETEAYFQITFGEGIGSYRGTPDLVSTGPNTISLLSSFGWMVGLHHEWTERLTSNFTFSRLSIDDVPGQSVDNLSDTTYLAVNLIANPYERFFCGMEYLYGTREDVSGARGFTNRLQASFGFLLP
jgi:hypothetical protein